MCSSHSFGAATTKARSLIAKNSLTEKECMAEGSQRGRMDQGHEDIHTQIKEL